MFNRFLLYLITLLCFAFVAEAQHPIQIQRASAKGNHFKAMADFEKLPRRKRTEESRMAAAKSAWALSLPDRAIAEFEEILRNDSLSEEERAKLLTSRGIIELQESRPSVAVVYAEKAADILDKPSPLRAHVWMLWGDSLYQNESHGAACQKFRQAYEESLPVEKPEIAFRIGKCEQTLGNFKEAKAYFERVPLYHEHTPEAVRNLAVVALAQDEYDQASFWLEKGRAEYPNDFLDSWVEYAQLRVAISKNDLERVREIRKTAGAKYPPSDSWLTMLNAAAEVYEWSRIPGGAK